MTRQDVVLTAMAPSEGNPYSPVQIQKLLFLIDREAGLDGSPHFNFEPYSYGPFDKGVYSVIENLSDSGLVSVSHNGWNRTFALTPKGQDRGQKILDNLSLETSGYVHAVSQFVRQLGFAELVSAIYKAYPEMKVNSVFREAAT